METAAPASSFSQFYANYVQPIRTLVSNNSSSQSYDTRGPTFLRFPTPPAISSHLLFGRKTYNHVGCILMYDITLNAYKKSKTGKEVEMVAACGECYVASSTASLF